MSYFEAIMLGLIQGLGEFLPVSSSGHLVMVSELFNFNTPGITFEVALHIGTLTAVVAYFWRDWVKLFRGAWVGFQKLVTGSRGRMTGEDVVQERLFWFLVVGSVPAALAGFFWGDFFDSLNTPVVAVMLIVFGVLLFWADKAPQRRPAESISLKDTVLIGLAQAVALIPGVSRSGATMTMGRLLKLNREGAARFSFLLSTPVIFGAGVFKMKDVVVAEINGPFVVGVVVAAVVGLLSIAFFMDFLKRFTFRTFMIYRVLVGSLVLVYWFLLRV
ncbi:MAG: undecaprenyl-diphosphate phosphatase [Peptococcaceae bacterium]|nr:undecaprenyl-diphosphate phosphatase [Peptococcaceae bacterium]